LLRATNLQVTHNSSKSRTPLTAPTDLLPTLAALEPSLPSLAVHFPLKSH